MRVRSSLFSVLLLLSLLGLPLGVRAQGPDYQITVASPPQLSGTQYTVAFSVRNSGGIASVETTAFLTVVETGTVLDNETVPPLATGQIETITFTFPADQLAPGRYTVRASLAADAATGSTGSSSLPVQLVIPQPANPGAGAAAPPAQVTTAPNVTTEPLGTPTPPLNFGQQPEQPPTAAADADTPAGADEPLLTFPIPFTDFVFDSDNPIHLAIASGVIGFLLIALWVILVILRLIFRGPPPTFSMWQPPYASVPVVDPNSDQGRRQLWQPHAQNDMVINPCVEGTYHIRKVLLGIDRAPLSGWHVSAMRMSQYDMYGRVARSQVVVPNGVVKKLDRIVRRSAKLDEAKAYKQCRPVGRALAQPFLSKVTNKSARLPIALDVRLRGRHGEVRILFELYGCAGGISHIVDQWEPEMTVRSGTITENFTYTVFGQRPDETMRAFRRRLPEDITRLLAEMVLRRPATQPPPVSYGQTPQFQPDTRQISQPAPHDTLPNPTPPVDVE